MKRWSLLVITAATVFLTGSVLFGSGWNGRKANRAAGPVIRTAPRESLSPSVALRISQGQPHHWRDCMLAR